jgi:ATP-binding cassette, subfamily B, bacterial
VSDNSEKRSWTENARRAIDIRLQFLRLFLQLGPRLVGASIAASVVAGVLPVALIVAGGALSRRIQEALSAGGAAASMSSVYRFFVLVLGLFLLSEIVLPVQSRLHWLVMKRVDGRARDRVMDAALKGTDMSHLHGAKFLDAMKRLRGLVHYSATPGGGAAGLLGILRDYLTGFAAAVVVASYQPLLAVVVLAIALFVRVQWRAQVIILINTWIDGVPSFNEARYFAELGLGRQSANEVRLFGLLDWIRQRVHLAGIRGWTPTWDRRLYTLTRPAAVDAVLCLAAAVFPLVWAVRAALGGRLDVGDLVVFIPALFAVIAVGRSFNDDLAIEYGGVMLPALDTVQRQAASAVAVHTGNVVPSRSAPPAIELDHISFRYPGADEPVLTDVSLTIPAGTSIALVGMNGAGKTTLVRLICGLYRPQEGRVLVDGVDLSDIDLDEWHRLIAAMFQEFLRLQVSAAENVGAGAVEHFHDKDGVRFALAEAGALSFAQRLPDDVETLLATRYADGTDLSGGQWQRLGIARALFALGAGARVLILDEPTSNLDTFSEERLVHRLLDDTRGSVTTLLVTHRLALARRADQILVVERGRLVERGSHDDLLVENGRYAAAFAMQSSLYPLEGATDA